MKMQVNLKGKSYDIEISQADEGKIKVKVDEKEFVFEDGAVTKERKPTVTQTYLQKKDFGEAEIKSPIAGIVSEIFVEVGSSLKKGDKILLLSAMKMENEIVSERDGKVKEIKITKNQQVKGGEVLIILAA
ncbi:MAG: acetyl-CoA carboxylase biotin carboxyl carrier protein subunit [bacterium]